MRLRALLPLAVLLAACTDGPGETSGAPGRELHVVTAGDFGSNADTHAVLEAMAEQDADLALALGDLSYGRTGNEERWCRRVTERLGEDYPFQLIAGNHDTNGEDGWIDAFAECLPNRLEGLEGTYAREWFADVPAQDPLVRFVMISPGLTFADDGTWDYREGDPHYEWTAQAIDGARAAGIPWVVVGAHKPCLTVGVYDCDMGSDVFDLLVEREVDLVLHGHEHHYARTHQLGLGDGCPAVPVDRVEPACIADADATVSQGAGTVSVTVGTGGIRLRDVDEDDPESDYFATVSAAGLDPAKGFLDLRITEDELSGRFVPIAPFTYTDAFTIQR